MRFLTHVKLQLLYIVVWVVTAAQVCGGLVGEEVFGMYIDFGFNWRVEGRVCIIN